MERALPELLILDIMLPEEDGLSILQPAARQPAHGAPARHDAHCAQAANMTRSSGWTAARMIIVTKPFGMMELISRVRALLRRAEFGRERRETLRCGDIECDTTTHTMRA